MASATKRKLSGCTDGMGVVVAAVATAGTLIHTAVAGTTPGTFDEIWLWAVNNNSGALALTIEFGNADAGNNITITIPNDAGMFLVLPGFILQNGLTVRAFASVANQITVTGFVNSITD